MEQSMVKFKDHVDYLNSLRQGESQQHIIFTQKCAVDTNTRVRAMESQNEELKNHVVDIITEFRSKITRTRPGALCSSFPSVISSRIICISDS